MTKSCLVCFKTYKKDESRSFHMFPKDIDLRKKWFDALQITADQDLSIYNYVCSDHFNMEDINVAPTGKRFLKKFAVPCIFTERTEEKTDSDSATLSCQGEDPGEGTSQYKEECSLTGNLEKLLGSDTETASETMNIEITDADVLNRSIDSTVLREIGTSTETASEVVDLEQSPPKKKRRLHYYGDIHSSDFDSPSKSKRSWKVIKTTVSKQKKQIINLQRSTRRLKRRIKSLNSLLKYLRQNHMITENAESAIQASLPGDAGEIFKAVLKGPSKQKYSACLRSFALTLNFYSPKAYNFVREKFNKTLPHPSTITKWYQTIDGSPGFTQEAQDALKVKSQQVEAKGGKVLCNLVMDEMAIRKRVEWTGKKFTGYVDVGTNLDSDNLPEAKEALVFMLVGVNTHWKVPVGYFLLDGLSGSEKANLVNQCLEFVYESGVIVTSLTFDGAPANLTMAKCLGAKLMDPYNIEPYFLHPKTQHKIFIFLDACHMLKLIRNCLGSLKKFVIGDKHIDWKYLEELVNLQDIEGLQAATKLKKRHLEWTQEKMRVKIAAQTFSKSVSDALNYLCLDLKLESFQGAEETANFIKIINDFFDILNSRSRFSKYMFQKPLSPSTKNTFLNFLENAKQYFLNLKLPNGTPVWKSARKTGFLGFLICAESLKQFYMNYIECDTPLLKYVISYKFSQDHLEIFFSSIRSRGGHNNNPTARQFEASYKKLLIHSEIKGSDSANAIAIDSTSILHCSSRNTLTGMQVDASDFQETLPNISGTEFNEHDYAFNSQWYLTDFVADIVGYISGFIVKSSKKKVTCIKCLKVLESDETISKLQLRKQYGRLVNASPFVVDVCQIAEKYFRWLNKTINIFNKKHKNLCDSLINQTMKNIPSSFFDIFGDHILDDLLENHSIMLTKLILRNYFTLRIHHECKKEQNSLRRVRSILTKTVLFRNQ